MKCTCTCCDFSMQRCQACPPSCLPLTWPTNLAYTYEYVPRRVYRDIPGPDSVGSEGRSRCWSRNRSPSRNRGRSRRQNQSHSRNRKTSQNRNKNRRTNNRSSDQQSGRATSPTAKMPSSGRLPRAMAAGDGNLWPEISPNSSPPGIFILSYVYVRSYVQCLYAYTRVRIWVHVHVYTYVCA